MLSKLDKDFGKTIEELSEEEFQEMLNNTDLYTLAYAFRVTTIGALNRVLQAIKSKRAKAMLLEQMQRMDIDIRYRNYSEEKASKLEILKAIKH
jgi:hypothetical protein